MSKSPTSYSSKTLLQKVLVFQIFIALVLAAPLSLAAQTRPLTPGDLPKTPPERPDDTIRRLPTDELARRNFVESSDAPLRFALSYTGQEFLGGLDVDTLVERLNEIADRSKTELAPRFLTPIASRYEAVPARASNQRPAAPFTPVFSITPILFIAAPKTESSAFGERGSDLTEDNWRTTGVNEVEIALDGFTANRREEITYSYETRYIRIRSYKREIVESQNGESTVRDAYIVERGTTDTAAGSNTIQKPHPRRLRATSAARSTVETVREVKVERCPDAAGIVPAEVSSSVTLRVTSAATGNGSPTFIEASTTGGAVGHVNDNATLTHIDWQRSFNGRNESLGLGENIRLSQTSSLNGIDIHGGAGPTVTYTPSTVSGTGTANAVGQLATIVQSTAVLVYGSVLEAYDYAEKDWRRGRCLELVVTSGAQPEQLGSGEARRIVIDAHHRYEPAPISIPVTSSIGGGTITPAEARSPFAAFTLIGRSPDGGGSATFRSVSKRGIAPQVQVVLDAPDDNSFAIKYLFRGLKFVDSNAEDCTDLRENGQEILTAQLKRSGPGLKYIGTGTFSADLDGCGLTPNRADPGQSQSAEPFGGFNGDNFLGCKVSITAPERSVRVLLTASVDEGNEELVIEFEPLSPPAPPIVRSACEAPWHEQQIQRLTQDYGRRRRFKITQPGIVGLIVRGGDLNVGAFAETSDDSLGKGVLTIRRAQRN